MRAPLYIIRFTMLNRETCMARLATIGALGAELTRRCGPFY